MKTSLDISLPVQPTSICTVLVWSGILSAYAMLVCPYFAGISVIQTLILFSAGSILAVVLQTIGLHKSGKNAPPLLCWFLSGCVIAGCNHYLLGFPPGSGQKVIYGCLVMGFYQQLKATQSNASAPLIQRYNHLNLGLICLPMLAALGCIWLINSQFSVNWAAHQLPSRDTASIILLSISFSLCLCVAACLSLIHLFRVARQSHISSQLQQVNTLLSSVSVQSGSNSLAQIKPDLRPEHSRALLSQLKQLKYLDPLTGVYNRHFLHDFMRLQQNQSWQPCCYQITLPANLTTPESTSHQLTLDAEYIRCVIAPEDTLVRLNNSTFIVIPASPDAPDCHTLEARLRLNRQKLHAETYSRSASVQLYSGTNI